MSRTERCRFCRELHDVTKHPELAGVCELCWFAIQAYLIERGFTLIGVA